MFKRKSIQFMKKVFISLTMCFALLHTVTGQSIDEALRYSQLFYGGTARFQSMGGAFTSLGGDLSVLSLNPAGLAMFRSADISFTPQMYFNNTEASFTQVSYDDVYNLNLNQAGIAIPIVNGGKNNSGLVSFNLGYSYNRTNDFNENALISGTLGSSSMVDYFMSYAEGIDYTDLTGMEGILFDLWMFDTIPGYLNSYASVFSEYGDATNSTYGQEVRRIISSEGYSAENAISAAANFSDKIYIGFTFGIHTMFSRLQYDHIEDDPGNAIYDFNSFSYSDMVETDGRGYSLKLGAILRPVNSLRIGFAVHSPVVYRLNEYYYDSASSSFDDGYYDQITNDAFRFSYTLTTPLKVTTGASLQLGKKAILSADYEFVDYKMARYSNASDDYNYFQENQDIKNIYDVAHNIRMGGEYRLSQGFYIRGGYANYGSGFAQGEDNRDNNYSVYSAGFGIRQSNFYFDVAYSLRSNTRAYFMYQDDNLAAAHIQSNRNMLSATIGFRL